MNELSIKSSVKFDIILLNLIFNKFFVSFSKSSVQLYDWWEYSLYAALMSIGNCFFSIWFTLI